MTITDLKVYIANTFTLAISFADIDLILKSLLVIVSIGYTVHKWIIMAKNKSRK